MFSPDRCHCPILNWDGNNFCIKPEDAAKITPEEIEMMRKYTEL